MGKKMKERKNTKISPDYISATAGNSGILRDMAGRFAGTGRYVVPTITAACAMQGTVMPMHQANAAVVTPADNATVGSGDTMSLPNAGISAVTSVTVNSGGSMTVFPGGMATSTNINSDGYMHLNGSASDTNVLNSGRMAVYSGGVAQNTFVSKSNLLVDGGMATATRNAVRLSDTHQHRRKSLCGQNRRFLPLHYLCEIGRSEEGGLPQRYFRKLNLY